jgi:hypothetical protein
MVMEWNAVEVGWFLVYTILVHQLPRPIAEAIFKRNTTGNGQRDLIISVATAALAEEKYANLLKFLVSAKNETNNLAIERNDIIHGDYHYSVRVLDTEAEVEAEDESSTVQVGRGDDKARRANLFAGMDLEDALPPLIQDIHQLGNQLSTVRHHLIWSYLPADKRSQPVDPKLPPGAEIPARNTSRTNASNDGIDMEANPSNCAYATLTPASIISGVTLISCPGAAALARLPG